MNLPNKLTLSRLFATFVFIVLLISELPFSQFAALLVFIAACITDWVDGSIARKYNLQTDFGKLMDPLADKILISSAFIAFIELPEIAFPAWIVVIIISREFAITGLRLLAATKGKVIPAGYWGKNKTISQIVTVISILVYLSIIEFDLQNSSFVFPEFLYTLINYFIILVTVITVLLTVISGIVYLRNSWHLIKEM